MHDRNQRPRILHAFANHELQAAELFAWALLAFPDSPPAFRRGLLSILDDEQRHCRMYRARLRDFALDLGSYPVTGYFWNKIRHVANPAEFVCTMSLTFENANLDHTEDYAAEADAASDAKTAALIRRVQVDEIEHVRFGWRWLSEFKPPDQTMWDAYCANIRWPLQGALARGRGFNESGRRDADLSQEFIEELRRCNRSRPEADTRRS